MGLYDPRVFSQGEVVITAVGVGVVDRRDFRDDDHGWYLSATWHQIQDLELYAAIDLSYNRLGGHDEPDEHQYAYTAAARYNVLENWLVKGEVSYLDGYGNVRSGEDGGEPEEHWWMLALKTTVDF